DAFPTLAWYDVDAAGDPKRRNPPALPIDVVGQVGKDTQIYCRVTPVPGGFFVYSINQRNATIKALVPKGVEKGAKILAPPANDIRTEHVVLVEALFPYREQVKAYLKALRVDRVEDLKAQGLMPVFDGLNVLRGTVVDLQPVAGKPGEFQS